MPGKPPEPDGGGSMTPSEASDGEERSERDSDYETDEEERHRRRLRYGRHQEMLNIQWTGYGKKTPVVTFNPEMVLAKKGNLKTVGERYHLAYKFGNSECKVVRTILNFHGFHEVHPNSSDYNFIWTGGHLKPFTLRSLTEFQKINHFPRSYELTRKDRLYKNVQRMQQIKGMKHFDILPSSFILPSEYQDFCAAFLREKGTWIVKPVASSRGRGVFLCNHPDQVPLDENLIVCRYLNQPLLIDGFKFDVRLYVCVTSYDPLVIYLFEEGLTRFATVKYEKSGRHIRNQCMHLTNYSVNKKSDDYVRNDDPDVEDYGNKWSLGALLRYLRSHGRDTTALMMRIEDVIIKAILSVELPIATACKMFMPFRGNCFELYGFDVLIDENMKPWVLEVNLSPSLACDAPLDLKIKTNLICDLFSLSGIICHDPMMRTLQQSRRNQEVTAKIASRAKSARFRPSSASTKQRPMSAGSSNNTRSSSRNSERGSNPDKLGVMSGLTSDEIKILRRVKEEESRSGGWVRIFPTPDTWDLYSSFLQYSSTNNFMLHSRLYPERHKTNSSQSKTVGTASLGSRARNTYAHLGLSTGKSDAELAECYADAIIRTRHYERKLGTGRSRRKGKRKNRKAKPKTKLAQGVAEEGEGEEEGEGVEEDAGADNASPKDEQRTTVTSYESGSHIDRVPVEGESENSKTLETSKKQVSHSPDDPPPKPSKTVDRLPPKPQTTIISSGDAPSRGPDKDGESQSTVTLSKPPVPQEPKFKVVEMLHKGSSLSKVQARSAFAMYLVRVQQRLVSEHNPTSQEDIDALNEQMDLVLRFLKRAAVNLQQQFKVIVPSRKLPLNDRRRILAKQLGDFVHIYNKLLHHSKQETEQIRLKKLAEQKQGKTAEVHPRGETLCEKRFEKFVNIASEGELEEVLTTYTRINKSASIFLGGGDANNKAGTSTESSASRPSTVTQPRAAGTSASDTGLQKRRDSTSRERRDSTSQDRRDSTSQDRRDSVSNEVSGTSHVGDSKSGTSYTSGSTVGHNGTSTYHTPTQSSYANAVQIYTQKLGASNRPRSASSQRPASSSGPRQRPMSAVLQNRPSSASAYSTTDPTVDSYNEQAIQDALQKLAIRQQSRQYSAHNSTSAIGLDAQGSRPPSGMVSKPYRPMTAGDISSTYKSTQSFPNGSSDKIKDQPKYVSLEDHYLKSRPPPAPAQRIQSAGIVGRNRNANATFNSFIEDTDGTHQGDLAMAYNQVTGVLPSNYSAASQSSKQFQLVQQHQALKQQSKAMLEQSKAKHQAMVAQAYAMQKSLQGQTAKVTDMESGVQKAPPKPHYRHIGPVEVESAMQKYAPKPPTQPSHTRRAGIHRVQRSAVPEESLNFNFHNSLKYDIHTGQMSPSSGIPRSSLVSTAPSSHKSRRIKTLK
ncbi:tubulin polyglutamylase TTLL5-like isoform X4 [Pecten maximus]|uniref:tubulin polyglutamylase TTLL5-like isoform X4 n=1 Tax=Pecten maximus TaxID=6579 RepID=UPI001458BAEA|nr:tubulin polyglutamylase TTLL5-like isoform X4 [Pecten maximus]